MGTKLEKKRENRPKVAMAEFLGHIGIHVYRHFSSSYFNIYGIFIFNSTLLERKRPAEKLNAMHRYMTSELFSFLFVLHFPAIPLFLFFFVSIFGCNG